jgi:hypothetical protein
MHFRLGKVFISHTAADKPFVCPLAARLEKSHFHIWLEERDLIAGGPLPQSAAKGSSTGSKKAADRMRRVQEC